MRMSSEGTNKTNNNKRTKMRPEDAKNVDSLETISIQRDTWQTPTTRAQVEARTDDGYWKFVVNHVGVFYQ